MPQGDLEARLNPAEAEDGFRRICACKPLFTDLSVSIQPKPKTGLEETKRLSMNSKFLSLNPAEAEDGFRRIVQLIKNVALNSLNPAEAEDGFRRNLERRINSDLPVSIQPKPKTGLEGNFKLFNY